MFPDNYNGNTNLEYISISIASIDYCNNSTSTSVDHSDHTNDFSSPNFSELMNCKPSTSTCSVSNDTTNRYSPYPYSKTINSAVSTSSKNHPKYGSYLPMEWTNEVKFYSLT